MKQSELTMKYMEEIKKLEFDVEKMKGLQEKLEFTEA